LILDSKNFFIKPTHLDLWKNILGCGSWGPIKNLKLYKPMIKSYAKYLGIKPSNEHIRDQTPFKISASYMDKIKNFDVFLEWFSNNPVVTSQFTFYSLLTQSERKHYKQQMPYITFWPDTEKKELHKLYYTKGINIIGLHKKFLSKLNFQEKNFVNNYIKKILEG